MVSELLGKQFRFARSLSRLLAHAHALGYEVTLGECYRSDEQAEINALGAHGREAVAQLVENQFPLLASKIRNNRGSGIRSSVHCSRLAVDLQLFTPDGRWLQESYPYELLAELWESLGPDHRAGVRFGDTPHFSLEWRGSK